LIFVDKIMNVRAHIFLNGKVQGVFFRDYISREASKRTVTGWVRNMSDGRVEAIFEGKQENVHQLIDLCRNGPPQARVSKIDIYWEQYIGNFINFKIVKTLF
jgi:acylphosphatase